MELRDRLLEAAEQAIRASGLNKTTTKEIARIAGCSEGSLYNHFQSKEDLLLQVIKGQLQSYTAVLFKLPARKGTRTVQENLEEVAHAALDYFYLSIVMTATMFTEPDFLARHRQGFQQRNEGPHRSNEIVTSYLRFEQQLGRVNEAVNPRSVADLLLGACFQHAFHLQFLGEDESEEIRKQFVSNILQTLMQGVLPQ
ncbi:TetR family transcriptional regulator [Paenibacillus pectinilyticus]|uniref:TetR family transcriptional regulator n=1 Tax=Paenibacillus pectinilyticus TaxID=512399 RepID=A0A1C0ZUV0_9BACL|nr:TetR/AcrR family transcriptional regulator [Paenibacillus pectinilyticus]OCT11880.1 TetR family transcriptional regulator [Paenibacillus pectinilyticus]